MPKSGAEEEKHATTLHPSLSLSVSYLNADRRAYISRDVQIACRKTRNPTPTINQTQPNGSPRYNMPAISEEGLGPVERGRIRYLAKNYTGALEAFTQAVKQSTGNLLCTALDYRAATHEKLENLQPALKDAKSMIDLKPDGAKGYLRCAKVLQLKGEKELALKIYERGLKKVAIGTDDARTKLQKEYTKLRKALDPGRSRDPLEYLPLEMAEIVIEHLDVRDRVYDSSFVIRSPL